MATSLLLPAVPVFFATSEGQTRRIAEGFASVLRREGVDSATYDVADLERATLDWSAVRGAILGASLHAGTYQRAANAFASSQAARLNAVPLIVFAVSLAAASEHREEVAKAQQLAQQFVTTHGLRPQTVASLAGRLAYTQYNFLTRFAMKRIARKEGGPTDTSRDYEFTNWDRVEALAREFAATVKTRAAA